MEGHNKEIKYFIFTIFLAFALGVIVGNKTNEIPTISQVQTVNINSENNKEKVNLNTATFNELYSLPYIGKDKAKAIIRYRETNKIVSVYDLKNIEGIGNDTISAIKDKVVVE